MGKPKKGKKARQDDDFQSDDETAAFTTTEEVEDVTKTTAGKKGKKNKKKKDDWEEDVAAELAALSVHENTDNKNGEEPTQSKDKKKDKKKKKQIPLSDEEDEDISEDDIMTLARMTGKKTPMAGMSAFQMLDVNESDESEEEEEEEVKPVRMTEKKIAKKQVSVEDDSDSKPETEPQQQVKQKKGKKGKQKKDEEDIDALLAEIDKPAEKLEKGKKGRKKGKEEEPVVDTMEAAAPPIMENPIEITPIETPAAVKETTPEPDMNFTEITNMTQEEIARMMGDDDIEDDEDDRKKKKKEKKKKKGKQQGEEIEKGDAEKEDVAKDEGEEEEEEGGTVKSAAQKKKEKRERQKQQKLAEKEKAKKKGGKKEGKEETPPVKEAKPVEEAAAREEKETSDKEDEDGDKKKKDKRKKKGKGGEDDEKGKKKPGKGAIKAMQEALQQLKEAEERAQKEEEEKEKRHEAARLAKEEADRKERERKEREKQKKKDRIEKQKAEGKYMTAKQKEAARRAQQMLEAMRAQGLDVPQAGEKPEEKPKRRIIYDNKKKKKQQQHQQPEQDPEKQIEPEKEESLPTTPVIETSEPPLSPQIQDVSTGDDVAEEEKDDTEEDGEIKDAWDVSSDEEQEEAPMQTDKKPEENAPQVEVKEEVKTEVKDEEEEDEEEEDEEEESSEEDSSSEEESSSDSDDDLTPAEKAKEKARRRIQRRHEDAEAKRSTDVLRAPVVCVLGHVDTGKTKILDKLRRTNVQDGEAGGITQQIGATNVPVANILEQTKMCKEFQKKELKLPGLLIIDTPGHESFSNLRTRGSSLCDIAILVVDIMHGLEPQTIESINLLKKRKTPFVVALNKIDRLFGWQPNPHTDVQNTIKKQKPNTKIEFDERAQVAIVQLAEQGLNAALFYENKNPREYISMVPTSAHSGDGMGSLMSLICELSQSMLAKRVAFSEELQAIVMEVKALPGLGTTIDVILVNGKLREGETIIIAGTEGPIITQIRGLLMPQPMKELRVKGAYQHVKELTAAQGVKIIAKELDHALAGLPLYSTKNLEEIEFYKDEVSTALASVLSSIKVSERGVFVQASTLGSLEALLEFLRTSKIPYASINIGPVHKKDIMKASVMLEHDVQYAVILAFDVKVERDAQEMADNLGVRIFTADIIYHLFDAFMAYREELKRKKQEEFKHIAVFPAKLRIMPQYVFNSRDPIVCGVVMEGGFIKQGTPLCVPSKQFLEIGRISSIEANHKEVDIARKGQEVCIKIEPIPGEAPKMFGRHFDETDMLVSKISRQSIDVVKDYFREEMTKNDWQLIMELKKTFQIL